MKKPEVPKDQPADSWMYAITASFADKDYVPPEAVKGAWQVGPERTIIGEFQKNPNFIEGLISSNDWPLYLEETAKKHPDGWVYDIDESVRDDKEVDKQFIKGSWKTDEHGSILPVFYPNENYNGPRLDQP